MNVWLDHVIWACSDLERGVRRFEALSGIMARYGGTHASGLTHNALVGIGPKCYLEILAPTGPATAAEDDWCRFARVATEPRLLTYCLRSPRPLADLALRGRDLGVPDAAVAGNGRTTPDGLKLRWEWWGPKIEAYGRALPFYIDWLDSPHPAESFAAAVPDCGVRLAQFSVGHSEAEALRKLMSRLETPIDFHAAPEVSFDVRLETPRGPITL